MKRMEFADLTPDKFDEIKGKHMTVVFKDRDNIVRTEQGVVSQIVRTSFIPTKPNSSLLNAIVFQNGTRVSIVEVIKFFDGEPAKRVYVEYE